MHAEIKDDQNMGQDYNTHTWTKKMTIIIMINITSVLHCTCQVTYDNNIILFTQTSLGVAKTFLSRSIGCWANFFVDKFP